MSIKLTKKFIKQNKEARKRNKYLHSSENVIKLPVE